MGTQHHGGRAQVVAAVAALLLVALGAAPAVAGKRAVGVVVHGKDGRLVEKALVGALKQHRFASVKSSKLEAAARGARVGLKTEAGLAAVARRLKLGAIVSGEVKDGGKRALVRVHGADGKVLADGSWLVPGGSRKLAAAVGRNVWSRIGGALEDGEGGARPPAADVDPFAEESAGAERPKPPPAPVVSRPSAAPVERAAPVAAAPVERATPVAGAPVAAASVARAAPPPPPPSPPPPPRPPARVVTAAEDPFAEPSAPPRPHGAAPAETIETGAADAYDEAPGPPPALDAMVGLRLVGRDLSWVKDASGSLRPFSQNRASALGFQIAWHPAAHFTTGWPTYLGVLVSGEYVPGVVARTMDGGEYPTSDSDYYAGGRFRMPFGSLDAAASVAFGQHAFVLRSSGLSNRANLAVPDVRYSYARVGVDGRLHLPFKLSVMAGGAYRAVLSAGTQGFEAQSGNFFPRVTVNALDVFAAVGYRFIPLLEARAGFDLRRYGLNMHPQTNDTRVVSGGIDQYLAFWLSLAVLLDR